MNIQKELKDLFKILTKNDLVVKRSKTNHFKVYDSNGNYKLTIGSTPSDYRTYENIKSQIKRTFGKQILGC